MKHNTMINTLKLGAIATMVVLLASCAAISTKLSHKDLDVQTKMSNSIFLPPVPPQSKNCLRGNAQYEWQTI